jgi:hypothetical protein
MPKIRAVQRKLCIKCQINKTTNDLCLKCLIDDQKKVCTQIKKQISVKVQEKEKIQLLIFEQEIKYRQLKSEMLCLQKCIDDKICHRCCVFEIDINNLCESCYIDEQM